MSSHDTYHIDRLEPITELVEESGLSPTTIKRMESLGTGRSSMDNVMAVQRALTTAGVHFIDENGGGAGVRLAKPERTAE